MALTITTDFSAGEVIWFVRPFTLEATSATVLSIKIDVDIDNIVIVQYFVDTLGLEVYIDSTKAFVSQAALAASYEPA